MRVGTAFLSSERRVNIAPALMLMLMPSQADSQGRNCGWMLIDSGGNETAVSFLEGLGIAVQRIVPLNDLFWKVDLFKSFGT